MRTPRGFTLVEIVVVIMVLGILAGVATGRFLNTAEEGRKNTLRASLDAMITVVEIRTAYRGGSIPAMILPQWFSSGKFPEHPYNTFGVASIQRVNVDGEEHPTSIVLSSGSSGAFWYNAANGVVRARVPGQGSRSATVALYSQVNGVASSDAIEEAAAAAS